LIFFHDLWGNSVSGGFRASLSAENFLPHQFHDGRAILYYPMSCGRNIDELLRVTEALQIADESKYATPANRRPGDPVIAPAPVP
jgi:hypothetical protein